MANSVTHHYAKHRALNNLSLNVPAGKLFGLLGPNGGGKTTLFRLLSTLLPVQEGAIEVLGLDVSKNASLVRKKIGVTFQSPSLDPKLTVKENLSFQARMYGLTSSQSKDSIARVTGDLGIEDRLAQKAEELSGGLKRRVEIAKGLLHSPELLLLDEPSTGLDPGARRDLWAVLAKLRDEQNVSVLVTTHLMEEAERCDQLAILHQGEIVAEGSPDHLRESIGGDCVLIKTRNPEALSEKIKSAFDVESQLSHEQIYIEHEQGTELLTQISSQFSDDILQIAVGKPTLEDVFIRQTGHQFWEVDAASRELEESKKKKKKRH